MSLVYTHRLSANKPCFLPYKEIGRQVKCHGIKNIFAAKEKFCPKNGKKKYSAKIIFKLRALKVVITLYPTSANGHFNRSNCTFVDSISYGF